MKARVERRTTSEDSVQFSTLQVGDWFQEDGDAGVSVKIGLGESLYLPDDGDDPVCIIVDKDDEVHPIQVTITY